MRFNMKGLKHEKVSLFNIFNNNNHKTSRNYIDGNGITRLHIAG